MSERTADIFAYLIVTAFMVVAASGRGIEPIIGWGRVPFAIFAAAWFVLLVRKVLSPTPTPKD